MNEEINVNLENLSNGAPVEMFQREWEKVLENILDPNTKATAAREVTLKVKVKPNEDREVGVVEIESNSKLAPVKGVNTMVYIGRRDGKPVAAENNPRQPAFDIFERSAASN